MTNLLRPLDEAPEYPRRQRHRMKFVITQSPPAATALRGWGRVSYHIDFECRHGPMYSLHSCHAIIQPEWYTTTEWLEQYDDEQGEIAPVEREIEIRSGEIFSWMTGDDEDAELVWRYLTDEELKKESEA